MVSLINFKIVNEDLQQQQQQPQPPGKDHGLDKGGHGNRMFVKVMQHEHHQDQEAKSESSICMLENTTHNSSKGINKQLIICSSQNEPRKQSDCSTNPNHQRTNKIRLLQPNPTNLLTNYPDPILNLDNNSKSVSQVTPVVQETPSFVVTWRNLRFVIEPKWHEKVVNPISAIAGRASSVNRLASVGANQCSTLASKIVLDKLDGSFKSGELTAILGPSGKFERMNWDNFCLERAIANSF